MTNELSTSIALMITADVVRSFLAPTIRPTGLASVSPGRPWISGMTATPVSNPDRPSASLGKTTSETSTIATGSGCSRLRRFRHSVTTWGAVATCQSASPTTTTLSSRYAPTRGTAIVIASRKPLRKTAASSASRTSVMAMCWPRSASGMSGFSTACAAASAADSVMVMTKSVAANPRSTRTNALPAHHGSRCSRIAIDPSPWGESRATRR